MTRVESDTMKVREFLESELDRRRGGCFPESHSYIRENVTAIRCLNRIATKALACEHPKPRPPMSEQERGIRRLQRLAKSLGIDTEQLYQAVGNHTVYSSDPYEDFGNMNNVSTQVRDLCVTLFLRYDMARALKFAEEMIREAVDE